LEQENMKEKPDRGEMLLLAVSRMHRLQIEKLGELDQSLTLRQYRILQRISQGYTSLSELSKLSHRSLPSTSESVDGLIRRKLLTRKISRTDRRAVMLGLTRTGEKALAAGTTCLDDIAGNFFADLPASKQTATEQIAHKMYGYAGDLMEWHAADPSE
jgi:DNA-binding MarR family transcriptional regulator